MNGLAWLWEPILCLTQTYCFATLGWPRPNSRDDRDCLSDLAEVRKKVLAPALQSVASQLATSVANPQLKGQETAYSYINGQWQWQWQWVFLYNGDGHQSNSRGLYEVPNTRISDGRWYHHPHYWEFGPWHKSLIFRSSTSVSRWCNAYWVLMVSWWMLGHATCLCVVLAWRIIPGRKWLGSPISHKFRPFGRGPISSVRGQQRSPWAQLTTHSNWDDSWSFKMGASRLWCTLDWLD